MCSLARFAPAGQRGFGVSRCLSCRGGGAVDDPWVRKIMGGWLWDAVGASLSCCRILVTLVASVMVSSRWGKSPVWRPKTGTTPNDLPTTDLDRKFNVPKVDGDTVLSGPERPYIVSCQLA